MPCDVATEMTHSHGQSFCHTGRRAALFRYDERCYVPGQVARANGCRPRTPDPGPRTTRARSTGRSGRTTGDRVLKQGGAPNVRLSISCYRRNGTSRPHVDRQMGPAYARAGRAAHGSECRSILPRERFRPRTRRVRDGGDRRSPQWGRRVRSPRLGRRRMVFDLAASPPRAAGRQALRGRRTMSDWREEQVGNETSSREINEWIDESAWSPDTGETTPTSASAATGHARPRSPSRAWSTKRSARTEPTSRSRAITRAQTWT